MDNGLDKCCAGEPTSGGVPINELSKIFHIEYIEKLPSFDELDNKFNETNAENMLGQLEEGFMDKENDTKTATGLYAQIDSNNINYYNKLTPEVMEDFILNLMCNKERYELTCGDIKDQLNDDKPINELKSE